MTSVVESSDPKTDETETKIEENEPPTPTSVLAPLPEKMRCIVQTGYGEFEKNIKLKTWPLPKPSDDGVLVKVHSVTLNPVDYKLINGTLATLQTYF